MNIPHHSTTTQFSHSQIIKSAFLMVESQKGMEETEEIPPKKNGINHLSTGAGLLPPPECAWGAPLAGSSPRLRGRAHTTADLTCTNNAPLRLFGFSELQKMWEPSKQWFMMDVYASTIEKWEFT